MELARRPDVAVVDHCLDRDAAMFRLALVRARVPVLLVSGLDDDPARAVAAAHRWSFLPKPFGDATLTAAVAALLESSETPTMHEAPSAIVPAAPVEALPPPTSWTCVGYVQLAAGGRIVWPFIAWQMNRNSGSGNVTATVTSIRYVTAT